MHADAGVCSVTAYDIQLFFGDIVAHSTSTAEHCRITSGLGLSLSRNSLGACYSRGGTSIVSVVPRLTSSLPQPTTYFDKVVHGKPDAQPQERGT